MCETELRGSRTFKRNGIRVVTSGLLGDTDGYGKKVV